MELHIPNKGGANSMASALTICTLHNLASLRRTLGDKEKRVLSIGWSKAPGLLFVLVWFCCYATARWGCIILMFISLRALPAGSYITMS
ncbi:hypothetical protein N7517_002811 [Penicillium concentricum]|uniref:Uncharacterized protein n=1 Tax=Penicillium concentricum TaxID=293559 RepID=A0A9W9SVE3_9EURO|nr:uncharacterized protein N7517_002811 [Penicillium concentricum]KAJ5384900.1 hypothetical protein N7517_002811 [Penicillium concentricum]